MDRGNRSFRSEPRGKTIGLVDRNVGLDLLIDRRRSVRRATKRDINHSVAEEIEAVRGLHAPRREIGERSTCDRNGNLGVRLRERAPKLYR